MIGNALEEAGVDTDEEDDNENVQHSDEDDDDETVADVFNTLTDKQKTAVYAMIGQALEEAGVDTDEDDDENEGGDKTMKHSLFDQETNTQDQEVLSHAEQMDILTEAKRTNRSLADTVLAHGITNIDYMFPDAQKVENVPGFIKREDLWVTDVMNSVHKTPFSRVKSVFADITEDDARAKGYIIG